MANELNFELLQMSRACETKEVQRRAAVEAAEAAKAELGDASLEWLAMRRTNRSRWWTG